MRGCVITMVCVYLETVCFSLFKVLHMLHYLQKCLKQYTNIFQYALVCFCILTLRPLPSCSTAGQQLRGVSFSLSINITSGLYQVSQVPQPIRFVLSMVLFHYPWLFPVYKHCTLYRFSVKKVSVLSMYSSNQFSLRAGQMCAILHTQFHKEPNVHA